MKGSCWKCHTLERLNSWKQRKKRERGIVEIKEQSREEDSEKEKGCCERGILGDAGCWKREMLEQKDREREERKKGMRGD